MFGDHNHGDMLQKLGYNPYSCGDMQRTYITITLYFSRLGNMEWNIVELNDDVRYRPDLNEVGQQKLG